jgi:hypothetical protein
MQRCDRPTATTYIRYHQPRVATVPLPAVGRLEIAGLFVLLSVFWGMVLFFALSQAL